MTDSSDGDAHPKSQATRHFSYHRQLSPLLWALVAIGVIEMGAVHLLLWHWNRALSLVVMSLSGLVLIWLVLLLLSFRRRPVEAGSEGVRVRTGFLIEAIVPWTEIAYVQSGYTPADYMPGSLLKASLLSFPNAVILLRRDIPLPGPFGRMRSVHAVALAVDEPAAFLAAMNLHLKGGERAAA